MAAPEKTRIGIVMNPIASIKPYKDSTLALMLAAQAAGAALFYMEPDHLFVKDGRAYGVMAKIEVFDNNDKWFEIKEASPAPLDDLDIILMRADPPVDKRFIHACYMLENAARAGVRVLNDPASLIALNEKLFAAQFPQFCPPTLVASDRDVLRAFLDEHRRIVIKPLDSMGGDGVFLVTHDDMNFDVIWEVQTARGQYPVIAQSFIPEITDGDKRVIIIDGKPFPHALVRTPRAGSMRGNMAAGGTTHVRPLNDAERHIAEAIGPALMEKGIIFAGIDIIGDRLIEINITSPTGLRQLAAETGDDPAAQIIAAMMG